jgi:phosphatidylglycerol---prolipoprotein diacylglyceryl transferase
LPYAEVASSIFPIAWLFGRLGCSIAHDHPGIQSDLFLAVQYPGGGRLDLGLIELLITIPLAIVCVRLWRKRRPLGTYSALACLYYAPLRFGLDFLRAREPVVQGEGAASADARYLSLTPAQWASLALFGLGLGLFVYMRRHRTDPESERTPLPAPESAQ